MMHRSHWILGALALAFLAPPGKTCAAVDPEAVSARAEAVLGTIRSILVEYDETTESALSPEDLAKKHSVYDFSRRHVVVVRSGDRFAYQVTEVVKDVADGINLLSKRDPKRFAGVTGDLMQAVTPQELVKAMTEVSERTRTRHLIYDGSRIWERTPSTIRRVEGDDPNPRALPTYVIHAPHGGHPILPDTYLHWMLLAPADPGYPDAERATHPADLIGAIKASTNLTVTPPMTIGGKTYPLVVQGEKLGRVTFDGLETFRMLGRDTLGAGGLVSERIVASDPVEVADDVVLSRVLRVEFFQPSVEKPEAGQPWKVRTLQTTRIEVNEPAHEEYFQVQPPAGSNIVDLMTRPSPDTQKHLIANKVPEGVELGVSYQQPASVEELDAVIDKAKHIGDGPPVPQLSPRSNIAWIVLANVIAVALLAAFIRVRSRRKAE